MQIVHFNHIILYLCFIINYLLTFVTIYKNMLKFYKKMPIYIIKGTEKGKRSKKMDNNSVARVYQFLSQQNYTSLNDWKQEVDETYGNSDGTLIKYEVRKFLETEFDFQDGDNKDDIVNRFWASIDTKTTGNVGLTGISNKNALDNDELKKMELGIKASELVNEFMAGKTPDGTSISNVKGWRDSVNAGVLNKVLDFLKKSNADSIDTVTQDKLEQFYQVVSRKATADYVASETIQDKLGDIDNYDVANDKTLSKIIDSYINGMPDDSDDTLTDIESHVKDLVTAYADTADTNSQSSIDKLGSKYNANGKLNDLQVAVLTNSIKDSVSNKLDSKLYNAYEKQIDAKLESYVTNILKGKKASEFVSLKGQVDTFASEFISTQLAEIKAEYEKFIQAQRDLLTYVDNQLQYTNYIAERKAAIKEVFGSDSMNEITKIINGYTNIDEVNNVKSALAAKIAEIDTKLANSILQAVPSTISAVQGGSFELNIDTKGIALTFNLSNTDCPIQINGNNIKLDSSKEGNWTTSIDVYNELGEKIGSKSINVKILKRMNLETSNASFNGEKISSLIYKTDAQLDVSGGFQDKNDVVGYAKGNIINYIDSLKSALSGDGYDSEKLEKAAHDMKAYYNAILDSIHNNRLWDSRSTSAMGNTQNVNCSFVDSNGNTQSVSTTILTHTYSDTYDVRGCMNKNIGSSGLSVNLAYSDGHATQITMNTQVLLRKLMEFYNA